LLVILLLALLIAGCTNTGSNTASTTAMSASSLHKIENLNDVTHHGASGLLDYNEGMALFATRDPNWTNLGPVMQGLMEIWNVPSVKIYPVGTTSSDGVQYTEITITPVSNTAVPGVAPGTPLPPPNNPEGQVTVVLHHLGRQQSLVIGSGTLDGIKLEVEQKLSDAVWEDLALAGPNYPMGIRQGEHLWLAISDGYQGNHWKIKPWPKEINIRDGEADSQAIERVYNADLARTSPKK
jgi:hypothetical protein